MFTYPVAQRFDHVLASPMRALLPLMGDKRVITLTAGFPDPAFFEYDDLRACYDYVLDHHAARAFQYAATEGEPETREAAALRFSSELPTTPDDVQVTCGSQEGLFLAGQALLDEGDVVLVESPTYSAALQAFSMAKAHLISVVSDEAGVIPHDLEAKIRQYGPKLLYLIPTFQNPSGRTMPLERRREVADILLRTGVPLVEDDPYSALRYEGSPVPPIASLEGMSAQTLLLNTASKTIAPGARIGWIRAEGEILRTITLAKQSIGLQSAVLEQLTISRYLTTCDLAGHIRRVTEAYRSRRDALAESLRAVLPGDVVLHVPEGGMFFWLSLGHGINTTAILPEVIKHGVAYVPGDAFYATEPDHSTMRLSFVTHSECELRQAVSRLSTAMGW